MKGLNLEDLENSPVVANVVLCFIMALAEKIMEMEFACPCDPKWNIWFTAGLFVVPGIIAFLLVMLIHVKHQKHAHQKNVSKTLVSIVTPLFWMNLLFLNGEYFVCGMTDWPGTFISVDETYLKWCSPTNTTRYSELLGHSHNLYILSQGIGIGMLTFFAIALFVYVMSKILK